MLRPNGSALQAQHDPEKWIPLFGQDRAQKTSIILKVNTGFPARSRLKGPTRTTKRSRIVNENVTLGQVGKATFDSIYNRPRRDARKPAAFSPRRLPPQLKARSR
jgi:hypothetical protein